MRIIGGKFGGRNILAPASLPVRPTTDYAKSGLFNILSNHFDFEQLSILDLFCGTGNISFEFASRGAKTVTCVDANAGCIKFVAEFALKIGAERIKAIRSDVFSFIEKHSLKYDIIFADPPFDLKETDLLPDMVMQAGLLNKNGWLIVEHQTKRKLTSSLLPLQIREYGNCAFSIYRRAE